VPDQVHLPRFSDPRDIDEFVATLDRFEQGAIGPEQFRAFRLVRGVYGQRQEGVQMLRVKIPMGRLARRELEALADVADHHSRGLGHVTTRQNVQFHFVAMSAIEAAMRRLDEAGLTTREACGHSVRNVTACAVAGVCESAPFDVTPYAEALVRLFLRHPLASTLPRKFKIAFSGCASDCALGAINDLGFIAQVAGGEPGFKVMAAGGLSTSPQAGIVLHEFVRASEIGRVGEAILRLFDGLGNRENKHRARLKYVLRKLGTEAFLARYASHREEVDRQALAELTVPDPPATTPAGPVESPSQPRSAGYLEWRSSSVVDQKDPGYVAVYARLLLGDIRSDQMRALAGVIEQFGDGTLRLSIDQNVVIPWVDRRSLPALHAALDAIGLARSGARTARDVTSCPGAETCNLAVTASRPLADAISARLELPEIAGSPGLTGTSIKISGCPHSCGQHHVADIGLHGAAKTVGGTTVPMYQLHLGGGVDARGARFGRQVVKIIARRVPEAVTRLLKLYADDRAPDEPSAAFFERVDPRRVIAALGEVLTDPPTPAEIADVGQEGGFALKTGDGECAA
jgi:sulfite reductase beta subunit-like hemoprotein